MISMGRQYVNRVGNGKARRTTAVALGVAAVLAGAVACGGGSGQANKADDGKASAAASTGPSASASPSAASGGPAGPGVDKLKAMALAAGDKAGRYEASEPVLDEPMSDLYDVEPVVCGPLTSLHKAGHTAQAYAKTGVPGEWQTVDTEILLRSYKDGGAAAAMKSLAEAGKQCAGGYTEERLAVSAKVVKVEPVKAPSLGDEALAYRIVTQDVKDKDILLYDYLTVIRSGSVTLSFRSDIIDTKDFGGVPEEIVTAQWEKFSKAGGAGS
ncbi:hypothetical protein OG625_10315 [Streptomyces sp. NBC_01351]|uniref:hypothetical protein n=1 Tax=Streptomyces sp. NBC_01351 TaxID=2903833 RepID=UPI002E36D64F|nr:hypothetical protein [Streptomyces sp. NBC_01351]